MPSVPLPFVVALLLAIVFFRLARREKGAVNPFFLAMIAACAMQSVVLGLRWGYGVDGLRFVQPVLAAAIPPLSWIAFSAFATGHSTTPDLGHLWPHLLAPLAVALSWLIEPLLLDSVLILIFLGYGIALIALARSGPDGLDKATFEGAVPLHRALQVTGMLHIVSALTDIAIAFDAFGTSRAHIAGISGFGSLMFLILLGAVTVLAGSNVPDRTAPPIAAAAQPESREEDADHAKVMAELDAMMEAKGLYRDPDLSLDRLARRLAVPARLISTAINRTRAINVSQYVNEHRVAAACRSLRETDAPITQILFEAGFQTKSNFNREFRRTTGMSPSAWREEQRAQAG